MRKPNVPSNRRYPPLIEKLVPIALAIIFMAILTLVGIAIGVALGYIP